MNHEGPKRQIKPFDALLQRWRIARAAPFVVDGRRVLDVGCFDGAFFRLMGDRVKEGVGIDRSTLLSSRARAWKFVCGDFPGDLHEDPGFSAIVMLAVFEHVPPAERLRWAEACAKLLSPHGRLILTVPSPLVDPILDALVFLRIAQGMDLENHSHLSPAEVPRYFQAAGLQLIRRNRFQLGLNNLFVFEKTI